MKMVVVLLGIALVAILVHFYMVKTYKFWKRQGVKQRPFAWFLDDTWTNALRMESPNDMFQRIYNYFSNVRYFGIYQFAMPTLVVKDPTLIKQLAIKDFDHFEDHLQFMPEDVDPLWGKNLFALQGKKKWHENRMLLSPAFTSSKLKMMFVLIREYAENLMEHLLKNDQNVYNVEAKYFFSRITNDLIATTSFGVAVDSFADPNNRFYLMGKKITNISSLRTTFVILGVLFFRRFFKLLKMRFFEQDAANYFEELTNDIVKNREENGSVRPDMINLMVQAKNKSQEGEMGTKNESLTPELTSGRRSRNVTNEDIVAQAVIFFLGGFDSVSSLMCFMAYELAVNPEVQRKLRKEICNTWDECGGTLTYDELSKMKYMDMVISEALRKWPNFLFSDRVCTKDYTIEPESPDEQPLHLKKGTLLMFPLYGIHHDPKYYPEPQRFDPERFNDENKQHINPYTYFPFGIGPRICLGSRFAIIETKAVFFYTLLNFEIVPLNETVIPVRASKKHFNLQPEQLKLGLKRVVKP
ncbi:hypothetical protein NQ318_019131 [Aromia moschata]|uniref:Cytochrome P450 n=1 Tax=Aromia moschata TaxID=1265417 RepID=A0AAV8YSE8_9CUCU|nr:hypothetical protein NQ318_019131 [Aromia moschata]